VAVQAASIARPIVMRLAVMRAGRVSLVFTFSLVLRHAPEPL